MAHDRSFLVRAAVALIALSLLAAGLLAWQASREGRRSADRVLGAVALIQQLVEEQENRDLSTRGELIAGNQAVVAYMTEALGSRLPGAPVDTSSVSDLLEERRSQLGLDMAAVIASDGTLLGATERDAPRAGYGDDPVFANARKAQLVRTGLWTRGGQLRHVAILPLARYGSGDAYLVVGQDVGDAFVQTIAEVAAADVAIVAGPGSASAVAASTLPPADAKALGLATQADGARTSGRFALALSGRTAGATSAPLFGNDAVRLVGVAPASASAAFGQQAPMLVLALFMLGLAAATLAWYWRKVAQPLASLEHVLTRAAETGDAHLRLVVAGTPALARIATAFNQLMDGLRASRR